MSQQTQDGESAVPLPAKKWRVHKRTIVVVFCVVLLPWILIAIPGTTISGGGSSRSSISHKVHGWPFVHLESTEISISQYWLKMNRGQVPPELLNLDKQARESAARYLENSSVIQLNLRHRRMRSSKAEDLGEIGYWSDLSNWISWKVGTHLTPRYLGLVLNLICLVFLVRLIAAGCERRIRRDGRLLKYSLASMLICTAFFVVAFAWIARMQQEVAAQKRLNDSLQAMADAEDGSLRSLLLEYQARFPLIVSQLFNHGKHSWGAVPFFRQVKSGRMNCDLDDESDQDDINLVAELAKETQYLVSLQLMDFSPKRQLMLKAMDGMNIVELEICYDSYDWMRQEFGGDRSVWGAELKRAGFEVELDIDMSRLKDLRLELDWRIPQTEQLKPFVGLPSLKFASISYLTAEGAEFILETKSRWPNAMEFDYSDDVSEELRQKLESEFDAELVGGGG